MLDARRFHLEGADPVAGGDDHVVGTAGVPDVSVLVELCGVLRVEPVAAEYLLGVLGPVPVADGVVRVRARAQTDLAALTRWKRLLVLVEDGHVPARHRAAHGTLSHLDGREVAAQRVALREAVVVEDREPVLLSEPADDLRVERLACRAHVPEALHRKALSGIGYASHRPQRGGSGEHALHAAFREEAELLLGVEAALARVYERGGSIPPGAEQGTDAGSPRPLTHAVEQLAVLHVVAELELLVTQQIAVRVQDALGQPCGA